MKTITPKNTLIVASVMMKLCNPERTISTPLTAPSAPPSASAPAIASGTGRPTRSSSQPIAIAAQTPMAPTDRLRPPVTITTIIEKPIMMSIAVVRPSVKRLNCEPKPGVPNAKIAPKIAISAMSPNSLVSSRRPGAGISVQAIAPRARLASGAAWELSIGAGASILRPIADQFAGFIPFSACGRRAAKGPDEESNRLPQPALSAAERAVSLRACPNSRAGTHGQVR